MLQDMFRSLLLLDALDRERHAHSTELDAHPKTLTLQAAEYEALGTELSGAEGRLAVILASVRTGEAALAGLAVRIQRAEDRMCELVTSTQVEATQRELATLRGQVDELELQVLEHMEQSDELGSQSRGQRSAAEASGSALEVARAAWVARAAELEARLAEIEQQRAPLLAPLGPDARRLYSIAWNLARFSPRSGLTTTDHFVCTTCRHRVSPKWVQEARSFVSLHACDSCKRVLAFDPDAPDPLEEVEVPSPSA
jgi:predicted  nucleic acid-binding Zn-ribbon protein